MRTLAYIGKCDIEGKKWVANLAASQATVQIRFFGKKRVQFPPSPLLSSLTLFGIGRCGEWTVNKAAPTLAVVDAVKPTLMGLRISLTVLEVVT